MQREEKTRMGKQSHNNNLQDQIFHLSKFCRKQKTEAGSCCCCFYHPVDLIAAVSNMWQKRFWLLLRDKTGRRLLHSSLSTAGRGSLAQAGLSSHLQK